MAKWIRLVRPDDAVSVLVNLAIVAWIEPLEDGSRITFAGGRDVFIEVRETPEQILAAPQVGW